MNRGWTIRKEKGGGAGEDDAEAVAARVAVLREAKRKKLEATADEARYVGGQHEHLTPGELDALELPPVDCARTRARLGAGAGATPGPAAVVRCGACATALGPDGVCRACAPDAPLTPGAAPRMRRRDNPLSQCPDCGGRLNTFSGRCPRCGAPPPTSYDLKSVRKVEPPEWETPMPTPEPEQPAPPPSRAAATPAPRLRVRGGPDCPDCGRPKRHNGRCYVCRPGGRPTPGAPVSKYRLRKAAARAAPPPDPIVPAPAPTPESVGRFAARGWVPVVPAPAAGCPNLLGRELEAARLVHDTLAALPPESAEWVLRTVARHYPPRNPEGA